MIRGLTIGTLACLAALLLCWPHRADARKLDEILARGAFSICVDPDAMPFSQRSGSPAGFEIDLAKILADRIGVRLDVHWIALRGAARGVNCDAIMSSLAQAQDGDA
jgi:polar amino acid transport system substrate-binding protein